MMTRDEFVFQLKVVVFAAVSIAMIGWGYGSLERYVKGRKTPTQNPPCECPR